VPEMAVGLLSAGFTSRSSRRALIPARGAQGNREKNPAECQGSAVEVAAGEGITFAVGSFRVRTKTRGLSTAEFASVRTRRGNERRIATAARGLAGCSAANRHPGLVRSRRCDSRICCLQAGGRGGGGLVWPAWGGLVDTLIVGGRRCPLSASHAIRADHAALFAQYSAASNKACRRPACLRTVDQRQLLFRSSTSCLIARASVLLRSNACAFVIDALAFLPRASARCASGARSPLAPTLPCDGTNGVTRG